MSTLAMTLVKRNNKRESLGRSQEDIENMKRAESASELLYKEAGKRRERMLYTT